MIFRKSDRMPATWPSAPIFRKMPEDIERQQRNDRPLDDPPDHVAKLRQPFFQRIPAAARSTQTEHEREQQRARHVCDRRHLDRKVRGQPGYSGRLERAERSLGTENRRVAPQAYEVGEKSGQQRRSVSQQRRDSQQPACAGPQFGYPRGDQTENDQRNGETQKVAEQFVECGEYP